MLTVKDVAPQKRVSKLGFEWGKDVRREDLPDHPLLQTTHSTFHKVGLLWRPCKVGGPLPRGKANADPTYTNKALT